MLYREMWVWLKGLSTVRLPLLYTQVSTHTWMKQRSESKTIKFD